MADYLKTRDDAEHLASRIREHWLKRGYPLVIVKVEEFARDLDSTPYFTIRSNLLNGLPPTALDLLAAA